jgi:hypothetical protein
MPIFSISIIGMALNVMAGATFIVAPDTNKTCSGFDKIIALKLPFFSCPAPKKSGGFNRSGSKKW